VILLVRRVNQAPVPPGPTFDLKLEVILRSNLKP
jgi:hypothetical protein